MKRLIVAAEKRAVRKKKQQDSIGRDRFHMNSLQSRLLFSRRVITDAASSSAVEAYLFEHRSIVSLDRQKPQNNVFI